MNTTSENMQDKFNETVEKTLEEYPGTDIQKAEKIAYDELKPKYLSDIISRYKYMSQFSAALYHLGLLSETSSRDKDKTIGRCVDMEMWMYEHMKMWRCGDLDV